MPRFACRSGPTVLQHPVMSGEPTVERLHDRPWWSTAPATATVVSLNVMIFAFPLLLGGTFPEIHRVFGHVLWNTPKLVRDDLQLWQLITANFVHAGPVHLSVNMLFVLWFGWRLERLLGTRRFALFYLATGIFAHAVYDLGAPLFGAWSSTGGASGCVLGILALHALCFPRYDVNLYGLLRVRFWWIVALFVISDISSFFPPGGIPWINHIGHLSGAFFGAVYWFLFARRIQTDEQD